MTIEMTAITAHAFLHPIHRTEVRIQPTARLWAFLFGPVYFATQDLWAHACFFSALFVLSAFIHPIFAVSVWLAYGIAAPKLIIWTYRKRGWDEFVVTDRPAY